jgi:hypothetical protein
MLSTSNSTNRFGPECLESKKALNRRRKVSLFRSSSGQQADERENLNL